MTKQFEQLEDALDLPSLSDADTEESQTEVNIAPTEEDVKTALENAYNLEKELGRIDGRDSHDEEMDELAKMAIDAHKDLQDLGMNVEIRHAGEIFSSSSQMLKIAVDAKNLKMEKKLRLMRLQLDKLRIDKANSQNDDNVINGSAQKLDRNELLEMIRKSDSNDK